MRERSAVDKILQYLLERGEAANRWLEENGPRIERAIDREAYRLSRALDRLERRFTVFAAIGLLLNLLAASVWPELPSNIPVLYGIFDGCLELLEFMIKAALGLFNALFRGQLSTYWPEYVAAAKELIQQAGEWFATLHF